MRKLVLGTFLLFIIILFVSTEYFFQEKDNIFREISSNIEMQTNSDTDLKEENNQPEEIRDVMSLQTASLHNFIGASSDVVEDIFEEPNRVDPSAYGYDWWVYHFNDETYLQFGIQDNKVVTIYTIGREVDTEPFQIGESYHSLNDKLQFGNDVESVGSQFFQFNLTPDELKIKPLVRFENVWVQLYFDSFTGKLSSIRYLDEKTLLKQRPYSITFRGSLPQAGEISEEEWEVIERGMETQVFDITNIIRKRHGLDLLEWHDMVSNVAYLHSEDMSINDYFSHTSPTKGELKDRLSEKEVKFQIAGENIAANYVDAASAVEGWLNSEGHRVNLLSEEFTHLGVGVYHKYYTQNFLTPWDIEGLHGQ